MSVSIPELQDGSVVVNREKLGLTLISGGSQSPKYPLKRTCPQLTTWLFPQSNRNSTLTNHWVYQPCYQNSEDVLPDIWSAKEPPSFQNAWAFPQCPLLSDQFQQSTTQSKIWALLTPAALLTPCLVAADALLLCQTTVICDWASIGRAPSLSSWDYVCDIIAAAQHHLIKAKASFILCLLSLLSIWLLSNVKSHQVNLVTSRLYFYLLC